MQQNKHYTWRIIVIGAVVAAGFWGIYKNFYKGDFSPQIKLGIDMRGGTSLIYEIKPATGSVISSSDHLAADVADALKIRVDPHGVKGLVWRPLGATRLEIQMPLSKNSGQAAEVRQEFSK